MKVKEIFTTGQDPIQSVGGHAEWLNRDNCQIKNITKRGISILVVVGNKAGGEGNSYIRVREEFRSTEAQLLSDLSALGIMGLTLNELDNLDVSSEMESLAKKYSLK